MASLTGTLGLLLRGAPRLLLLVARALRDPRISLATKSRLLTAGLYVASPIDLIPELFLGGFAYGDDVLVVFGALNTLLTHEHPAVLAELWSGSPEDLARLQHGVARIAGLSDRWVRPIAARLLSWLLLGRAQSSGGIA